MHCGSLTYRTYIRVIKISKYMLFMHHVCSISCVQIVNLLLASKFQIHEQVAILEVHFTDWAFHTVSEVFVIVFTVVD